MSEHIICFSNTKFDFDVKLTNRMYNTDVIDIHLCDTNVYILRRISTLSRTICTHRHGF